ncbi:hypothetical protein BE17_25180 [Sorangium cellulosum]|uniref:Uncharacterized protein n=1 Tax=Sorangium cellulosum TaxID=56 RepID=A0A150SKN1_SORCE|nr:hypothetical protein BE17_25180 [Sorangium cellulosum]
MIWPLEQTFDRIRSDVPGALVTPGAWESVLGAARRLPRAISCAYLECRLGRDAAEVDLGASVMAAEGPILLAARPTGLPSSGEEATIWGRVQELTRVWTDPASPLHARVPVMWLELDSGEITRGRLMPSVLLCVDPSLPKGAASPDAIGHGLADCAPSLQAALSALSSEPLAPAARADLHRCFEALPAGGRIVHVGFMVTRRPTVLKLFAAMDREQVLDYLGAIRWPGSLGEAASLVDTLGAGPDTFRVDLTIGETLLPRLGLEFASRRGADPDRRALIDRCVEHGICTPEKRDALISWPGSKREVIPGYGRAVRLSRWIDMKIVHRPPEPLEAKAYLGFMLHLSLL